MKTVIVGGSFLDGLDPSGSSRFDRVQRWLNYCDKMKPFLGLDGICLLDNGSSPELWDDLSPPKDIFSAFRFFPRLERGEGPNNYPYCWRNLWELRRLIREGVTKIIALDTDSFIVSKRMADHVKNLNTGWESFWIPKYDFPSAECFVLCEDAFEKYFSYTGPDVSWTEDDWEFKVGTLMETDIPFTKINKDFNCDRFGETRTPQTPDMDGYFQAPTNLPLVFNMK